MIGVGDDRRRDSEVAGSIDRPVEGDPAGVMTPPVAGVESSQSRSAAVVNRSRRGIHDPRLDEGEIARQPGGAV